jgi:hypothetical protein
MRPDILSKAAEATFWTQCRLHVTMPSVLAVGETFCLRIDAIGPDKLPFDRYARRLHLEASPGIDGLPAAVSFPPGCAELVIEGLTATGPSPIFVNVRPEGCPDKVPGNPAWVMKDPPWRLYWGDLHVHTTYSNCSPWACKDPEFCYEYARGPGHLDFAAAADHLRGIVSAPERWPRLQELVRRYDEPGRFVPILAFESSHKTGFGGDINAYLFDPGAPYFWIDRADMRGVNPAVTLRELWDFLDAAGGRYFTVPHHTGRAGKYRSFGDPVYDAAREPLFEVYSCWGSSESRVSRFPLSGGNSDRPSYFQDALRAGCRYGVIGSSDDHQTLPGWESLRSHPAGQTRLAGYNHHGLAAVRCRELTRAALWGAFMARRCYATTFSRTLLDVHIGDVGMGAAAPLSAADPLRRRREITVRAASADRGRMRVTVNCNGVDLATHPYDPAAPDLRIADERPADEIAIRDAAFHPAPFLVYYVRIEDPDGQTQWSSPIWFDLE